MGNIILGYPDYSQGNSVVPATLSGGAWTAGLPLANLQQPILRRVARTTSTDLSATRWDTDYGVPRNVRLFVLLNHNLSAAAKVRFRLWHDAGHTSVAYDSGWLDVWNAYYPPGSLEWESPAFWDLLPAAEDLAGYRPTFIHIRPTDGSLYQYASVDIDDTGNSAGYIQLSRAIASPGWSPEININWGADILWADDSTSERSLGGIDFWDVKESRRQANMELDQITDAEALGILLEMQRRLGKHGQVYLVWDSEDNTMAALQRSFLATFRQLSPLEYVQYNTTRMAFAFEEVL